MRLSVTRGYILCNYFSQLKCYSQLYCNTLNKDLSHLVEALNCFDNTKMVSGFPHRLLSAVDKHFLDSGLKKDEFTNTITMWYHIPLDEALHFNIEYVSPAICL